MGLFCFLLLLAAASLAAPITFPGYVGPDLHGDAGYLTHGTSRLYYIHTSLVPPEQVETLLFWFQGGPGGTSWIGLATEMGPIEFVDAKTALYRPINWLQANKNTTAMVFIDNPACIGFSYTTDANKTRGCASGDSLAADQNAAIVPQFLNEMMQGVYRNTSFFITGESWGGEYIPTMAAQPSISTLSNFRGILIGNPVFRCFASSDPAEDRVGDTWTEFNQLYWNGYISQDVYEKWRDSDCDSESHRQGQFIKVCFDILSGVKSHDLDYDFSGDDRFADFCTGNASLAFAQSICTASAPNSIDSKFGLWINDPDNAAAVGAVIPFQSEADSFSYNADLGNLLPYYAEIKRNAPNARVLIYSGLSDVDTCPFSFTMPCLNQFYKEHKMKKTTAWQTWTKNGHVYGNTEVHDEWFTYATIRGAGHEVPLFSPLQAFEMIDRYLKNGSVVDSTPLLRRNSPERVKVAQMRQSELMKKYAPGSK